MQAGYAETIDADPFYWVFGNVRHNKRLNRFTPRGRKKVDTQWKLYAMVHNIEKLAHYGCVMPKEAVKSGRVRA